VRVAIVAEVPALRKITVERDYLAGLIETANELLAIPQDQRPVASLQVRSPEHYCRVYVANLGKLGYRTTDQLLITTLNREAWCRIFRCTDSHSPSYCSYYS